MSKFRHAKVDANSNFHEKFQFISPHFFPNGKNTEKKQSGRRLIKSGICPSAAAANGKGNTESGSRSSAHEAENFGNSLKNIVSM